MRKQIFILTLAILAVIAGLYYFEKTEDIAFRETMKSVDHYELTPEEWRARELAMKKERREEGYSKMDRPDLFYEYHNAIRTPEGETSPQYAQNYRIKELVKAKSRRQANVRTLELDWISRGPNNVSGRTRTILPLHSDPLNTWLAGAVGGGIWKTTNGGQSWVNKSGDLPTLAISSLASSKADPSIIYAGTGELVGGSRPIVGDGIFKSTDFGETWIQLTSTANSPEFRSVTRVIVDPENEDIVIASTAENYWDSETQSQIMRSTDGGETWTKVYESASSIEQIVYTPGNFNVQYATVNRKGVIKSIDGGQSWSDSFVGMQPTGRIEIAVSPVNPNRLFASAEGALSGNRSDLYISNDAGSSWVLAADPANTQDFLGGQGGYDNTIMADPYDQNIVYYGGVNLWRSVVGDQPSTVGVVTIDVDENKTENFWDVFSFTGGVYYRNGMKLGQSPAEDFVSVEIRFGPGLSQKAHRFTVPAGSTSGVPDEDHSFQDYIDVPFEVWDIENDRQLMVSFRDQGRDGSFTLKEANTTGQAESQSREYLYIHSIDYNPENPAPEIATEGGQEVNQLYFIWPVLVSGGTWDPEGLPLSKVIINYSTNGIVRFDASTEAIADAYGEFSGINRFPQSTRNEGIHPDHHFMVAVKVDESQETYRILEGNDGGVYISNISKTPGVNDGDWDYAGYGYVTTQFYGADKKPGADEYIGGMQDNGTWKSPTGVESQSNTNYEFAFGGDGFQVLWNKDDPQKVIGGSQYNGFVRTSNDGNTWFGATSGLTGTSPFFSKLEDSDADPDLIFTVTSDGVFRSDNFGGNWTLASAIPNNFNGGSFNVQLDVSESDPMIIWTGAGMTVNNKIHVSADGGITFKETSLYEGTGLGVISGFATHPVDPQTAYALFSFSDRPKILRTTDLGQNWEDISGFGSGDESLTGFPDVAVYSLLVMPYDPSIIWVGTDIGLFESTDNGATWHIADNGFPAVSIWQMKIVDDLIVVATHGRGIWSLTLPELNAEIPDIDIIASGTTPREELIAEIVVGDPFDSMDIFIDGNKVGVLEGNESPVQYTVRVSGLTEFGYRLLRVSGYRDGKEFRSFSSVVDYFKVGEFTESYFNLFDSQPDEILERGMEWKEGDSRVTSSALHSKHPYRGNRTDYALLTHPVIISENNPKVYYEDIALVEPGEDGALFGTPEFKDYVVIEGSLDGMYWTAIESGYDASLYPEWENTFFNNLVFARDEIFRKKEADLSSVFNPGDTIFIRLSIVADNSDTGYGWILDNLYVQEEPLGLGDPWDTSGFDMVLYPNPVIGSELTIEYHLDRVSGLSLEVIDFTGRILEHLDPGPKTTGINRLKLQVEQWPAGTYLLRLSDGKNSAVQRVIVP